MVFKKIIKYCSSIYLYRIQFFLAPDNGREGQFKGTIDGDYHVIFKLEISNEEGKANVSSDFARGFIAFSSGATVKNP